MSTRRAKLIIVSLMLLGCALAAGVHLQLTKGATPSQRLRRMRQEMKIVRHKVRAVIFIRLDWTIQDTEKQFFRDFQRSCNSTTYPTVYFKTIDFSVNQKGGNYSPLSKMPGWKDHEPMPGQCPITGNGQMFWIANGRIVDKLDVIDFNNVNQAVDFTERVFSMSEDE